MMRKTEPDIFADRAADEACVVGSAPRGTIYCANCIRCKLVPSPAGSGSYYLRVRCDAGQWRKKSGEEKIYKYFTVARRSIASCSYYEDMGEGPEFLKDLRATLPAADELYGAPD